MVIYVASTTWTTRHRRLPLKPAAVPELTRHGPSSLPPWPASSVGSDAPDKSCTTRRTLPPSPVRPTTPGRRLAGTTCEPRAGAPPTGRHLETGRSTTIEGGHVAQRGVSVERECTGPSPTPTAWLSSASPRTPLFSSTSPSGPLHSTASASAASWAEPGWSWADEQGWSWRWSPHPEHWPHATGPRCRSGAS